MKLGIIHLLAHHSLPVSQWSQHLTHVQSHGSGRKPLQDSRAVARKNYD